MRYLSYVDALIMVLVFDDAISIVAVLLFFPGYFLQLTNLVYYKFTISLSLSLSLCIYIYICLGLRNCTYQHITYLDIYLWKQFM